MGSSVAGKYLLVRYAPGTRTSTTAVMLCTNDSSERPMAQKYPLKLKWIPAKKQSQIYPRRYQPPATATAASLVNRATALGAINCTSTPTMAPKVSEMPIA